MVIFLTQIDHLFDVLDASCTSDWVKVVLGQRFYLYLDVKIVKQNCLFRKKKNIKKIVDLQERIYSARIFDCSLRSKI